MGGPDLFLVGFDIFLLRFFFTTEVEFSWVFRFFFWGGVEEISRGGALTIKVKNTKTMGKNEGCTPQKKLGRPANPWP